MEELEFYGGYVYQLQQCYMHTLKKHIRVFKMIVHFQFTGILGYTTVK
jgi:hypothetical protein